MAQTLTDALLRGVKAPSKARLELTDQRCPGLVFRVTPNDVRSWSFRFRDPRSGKPSRATIGPYPTVPLADARQRALLLRQQVAAGTNPVEAKRQTRSEAGSKTFAHLADRYLAEYSRRFKKSSGEDDRNIKLHLLPKWKNRSFEDIGRRDVIELLEGLVKSGKHTLANRVQALISSMYAFAIDADIAKANPVARLKRRGTENVRDRVLNDAEINLFWQNILLPPVSRRVGLALRLILLTGTRPGEVATIEKKEIEFLDNPKKARWQVPADKSKNGRAHLVPLSPLAISTIKSALELSPKDHRFVFPSPAIPESPITAHALAVAMGRFAKHVEVKKLGKKAATSWLDDSPEPHDLRRTVATRLAQRGVTKEDRDAILNHTPRDVGKKHYDRYERENEKRNALAMWATEISNLVGKSR